MRRNEDLAHNRFLHSFLRTGVHRELHWQEKNASNPAALGSAWIWTPGGPVWCPDVNEFRKSLGHPFCLISLGAFGFKEGFCVCDVQRRVMPVVFRHVTSDWIAIRYFAMHTTAGEVRKKDDTVYQVHVPDDFVVHSWGHVGDVHTKADSINLAASDTKHAFSNDAVHCHSRCLLNLQTLLQMPSNPWRCTIGCIPESWHTRLHALWQRPLVDLPGGLQVHAATSTALAHQPGPETSWTHEASVIYVDGSATKHGQAWSVVATKQGVVRQEWSTALLRICTGKVIVEPEHPHWIGAMHATALKLSSRAFMWPWLLHSRCIWM